MLEIPLLSPRRPPLPNDPCDKSLSSFLAKSADSEDDVSWDIAGMAVGALVPTIGPLREGASCKENDTDVLS